MPAPWPRSAANRCSADVRSRAKRWLDEVDRRLDEQKVRRDALARRQRFEQGRNEVLFRGTQPVDGDAPANLRAAQDAARTALDAVGLSDRIRSRAPPRSRLHRGRDGGDPDRRLRAAPGAGRRPRSALAAANARQRAAIASTRPCGPWIRPRPLHPPSRAYHQRRAQILALQGDAAGARAERTQADSLPPAGALDAFLAGVDRFMGGSEPAERAHLERAIDDFRQALRLQPDHFWAHYYLAVACLNSDRPELAIDNLTECIGKRPDWIWAYLLRGSASGRLGQFDLAEADFRKAEQLHPNPEALYALFINRGALRYAEGRLDEAGRDFERASALRPGHYQAIANLAFLRKKQGRLNDALEEFGKAIAHDPPALIRTDLQTERALLLSLAGRPQDALDACETILESHPRAPEVLGIQAQALLTLNRDQDALRSFDRYLDVGGPPTSDVYRGRGQARMKLGEFAAAVDDYTRALLIKPDWDIQTHRGWAYFFAEAPGLALRDFDAAVQLNPANVDAYHRTRSRPGGARPDRPTRWRTPRKRFGASPERPRCGTTSPASSPRPRANGAPTPARTARIRTSSSRVTAAAPSAAITQALSRLPVDRAPGVLRERSPPGPLPRSDPPEPRIPGARAPPRRASLPRRLPRPRPPRPR